MDLLNDVQTTEIALYSARRTKGEAMRRGEYILGTAVDVEKVR